MKLRLLLILIIFTFTACVQSLTNAPNNTINKFEEFKNKEKFIEDKTNYYPGIANSKLRHQLTEKINLAANDFEELAKRDSITDKDYQDKMKIGLQRFKDIYINLDTEDRERVCYYFKELMDIVGVKSSGGHLNNFMYGFDPTK